MTQTPKDETGDVHVEQVDREAAAKIAATVEYADLVRRGLCDMAECVQAFARHRLAALSDRAAEQTGRLTCMTHAAFDRLVAEKNEALSRAEKAEELAEKYKWQVRDTCTRAEKAEAERDAMAGERNALLAERDRPETADFMSGLVLEAAHQRARWGSEHDAGKAPLDWYWLIGYLAQKAATSAMAGDQAKALHHTISTAAALANWHLTLSGGDTDMRPGIEPPAALVTTDRSADGGAS